MEPLEQILWAPSTAPSRKAQVEAMPELVTTYRKGTKWFRADLVGKRVVLVDQTNNEEFAFATVKSVKACAFKDIDDIDHQRQSSDMTPERRLEIMRTVYGGEYDMDTLTTIVTLGDISEA